MDFMGMLRGIGSGAKHAGGALKKTLDDPERMSKFGRIAQGFGKGAQDVNPDSQLGRAVGGAGKGMQRRAAQKYTPPDTYGGAEGANQSVMERMQVEDVQLAPMPAPASSIPMAPMEAPYMPPDVEMDEQGNYRRKGGMPLVY